MIPAVHVIMTFHYVLVLLPLLGFLVLPCESIHSDNGLRIVANMTVKAPGDCDVSLCPNKSCTHALLYDEKHLCFLINCMQDVQGSSCGNVTNIKDLLAEQEYVHVDQNKTDGSSPPHESSGNIIPQPSIPQPSPDGSSASVKQLITPIANISTSSTSTKTSTVATKLQPQSPTQSATTDAPEVPTTIPPTTIPPTTIPPTTIPPTTSTPTTTITTTTMPNTTKPSTTSTSTTATTEPTTVKWTTLPSQPSSRATPGNKTSASITPLVPTTPPSTSSSKVTQPSPAPSSTKPSPTRQQPTSTSPSVVATTLPKDISGGERGRTDQANAEVAGDPLTIHLLNTSSLLAVLIFGLLFFVVIVALFLKQAYESYKRKDYTQVDYLINGMYSDSGV